MATLKELVDEFGFGVKFCRSDKGENYYFEPRYYWNNLYIGIEKDASLTHGTASQHFEEYSNWKIYKEPKKKVKMWKWLVIDNDGEYCDSTSYFDCIEMVRKYHDEVIQKLDYTEIEVEV